MGLIFRLSMRNLFRQKKRNFFLGTGIAFGMTILVIANSFSHGMVDVLIQDVISYAFGHLVVQATPGNSFYSVIRDKERLEQIVQETIPEEDLVYMAENLGMMATAVGNGESDNVIIVGVTADTEQEQDEFFGDFFSLVSGDFTQYNSDAYDYPVIVSEQMARSLNVGLHDSIRIRVPMVTGQIQTARLTVIAMANANNSFMDMVIFMDGRRVKELLGYQPWEAAGLQITLRDPKRTATHYANLLHEKLQPSILAIDGQINEQATPLLAFQNNEQAKAVLLENLRLIEGDIDKSLGRSGLMISEQLAARLNLVTGESFTFSYDTQFRGEHQADFTITGIYQADGILGNDLVLANEELIHSMYSRYLPRYNGLHLDSLDPIYPVLATEWKLLDRTANAQELSVQTREERRNRTNQTKYSVLTMYEGASDILRLEEALNLITVFAVLVLFVIILIGVMNTLRMSVRERTREIGTVRAIGMQKRTVRNMFLLETLLLTTFACIAGVLLAIGIMQLLGSIEFETTSALSVILKNKRLFFKLNPTALASSFVLILFISGLTAWFPAKKAANLAAVDALRR